jgi:diguanylate cyclase (GGDEF)-like protein
MTDSKERILIVDDMPGNLRILMQMLGQHGYVAHPAADAEAAFRFLDSVLPDLILLDIVMPDTDGYQLCAQLKAEERTRDIPVIFISSADQELDKMKAFESGGVDYIVRPLQTEEVLARIKTHLSLCKLRKRLEVLVEERTAQLMEANAKLQKENAERKQAEKRIRYMAHYDALTGLPNRVLLEDRIEQAIAHAQRDLTWVAVMFIDLDYFKHINDSLGHHVGDRLLQVVARRLEQCLRRGDSVARLGGDEFVLSVPSLQESNDIERIAQKVLDALDQSFHVDGHELQIGGSIGIAIYPCDGKDVETLMRAADTAMYHAKERGRSNYQFFTPELNRAAQHRMEITSRLRRALTHGDFALYYQPQVNIEDGAIFCAEALLRCLQPDQQTPSGCAEYIAVAEETGLILPIGEWVLREACRQLRHWRASGYRDMRIAVNLSSRQFCQPNFVGMIKSILDESELPAAALDLEITESLLLQRNDNNVTMLRQLSEMGVQLSIDDFGTGYSSLAYLQRFPVHALKIDQSFVRGIGNNRGNTALVMAVIAMAQSLDLKVLAEGVETAQQAGFLKSHGCPAAQGFYYSEAVPPDSFTALLTSGRQPIPS